MSQVPKYPIYYYLLKCKIHLLTNVIIIININYILGSYKIWLVEYLKDNQDTSLTLVRDAHDLGINCIEFSPQHSVTTSKFYPIPYLYFNA